MLGLNKVLWGGVFLYVKESRNHQTMERYGHGTPNDWLENRVYTPFQKYGIVIMLGIDLVLFGLVPGFLIWGVQMLWIPFWAAGVINGVGHFWGYRNFDCADAATNILPWGILIGGEELHNNHHSFATSAKLSNKWYEFDIGWMYIRILSAFKLATVRKVAPQIRYQRAKPVPDHATLQAVLTHRYHVATSYARSLKDACAAELVHLKERAGSIDLPSPRRMKRFLLADPATLSEADRLKLTAALAKSKPIATIYSMRQELASLWERSTESSEQLLARLQDWCHRAEASGIAPLAAFSHQLRRYA